MKHVKAQRVGWLWVGLALFFLFAGAARGHAQKSAGPSASDLRVAPDPAAVSPESPRSGARFRPQITPLPRRMSLVQRRVWFALGFVQHGAAFFDARTTRQAMSHYRELDPLLRPFAHSPALYPAMQIGPFGLDWLAKRMATSRHKWMRRLWWLPQAAATAGFLWSGAHNLSLPVPGAAPAR